MMRGEQMEWKEQPADYSSASVDRLEEQVKTCVNATDPRYRRTRSVVNAQ